MCTWKLIRYTTCTHTKLVHEFCREPRTWIDPKGIEVKIVCEDQQAWTPEWANEPFCETCQEKLMAELEKTAKHDQGTKSDTD